MASENNKWRIASSALLALAIVIASWNMAKSWSKSHPSHQSLAVTEDAYLRAQTIAENAKSSVGRLSNANMGIFQITGQNSNENYSWGGSFNPKSKYKTASITVKLEFDL